MAGRRDLLVLSVGLCVSVTGDAAALVALLLRLRPEGSGWVAAVLAAELVPTVLLAAVAGRVVDRFETHRVLLLSLAGQAALAVPLALVSQPWATVTLFTGLNVLFTVVRPATATLVPVVTGAEGAPTGYARLATGSSLGYIIGPAAGGLLTARFGSVGALLVDAATFVLLVVAVSTLQVRRPPVQEDHAGRPARGGFGLLWHSPVLRVPLLVSALAVACAVVDNVAAPFRFIDQLGSDATGYGLYLTIWGVGAFLGVQVLPRVGVRRHAVALAAGNLLVGLGIAGIGLAPTVLLAYAASALGGVGNGLTSVTQSALISANTPADRHGRAFSAASAVSQAAAGTGTAAAAPLVVLLGAGGAMASAGLLSAVAAGAALVQAARRLSR